MSARHSRFVTLVFESPRGSPSDFDEHAFASARRGEAGRIGAVAEVHRFAPIRAGSAGPELVTVFRHDARLAEPISVSPAGTNVDAVATYTFRNEVEGSREGAEARGLLLGITDCSDAARIDEFQRWYDQNHAADVVRSGIYESAARYERVEGDLGEYLALYSTSRSEPEAFRSYLAWPERDRSRCEVFVVRTVGTFRRIG